ncbi:DUF443 family protein [Staphylococcus aureus]|nr:DUF443 family protein [Staphylococcus aureus]
MREYKVVQYNDEYLLIDFSKHLACILFSFINWFIPKRYAKLQ